MLIAFLCAVFAADPPEVSCTFRLLPGPRVEVTLAAPGDSDGTTDLEALPQWGGIENVGGDFTQVHITDSRGGEIPCKQVSPTHWVGTHTPSENLIVSYIIPSRQLPPTSRGNDYRTRLDAKVFHLIGELGLLVPKHLDDETERTITVAFSGFDADGWRIVSSFGNGAGPFTSKRLMHDVRHTLVMGGQINVLTREVHGNTIGIALTREEWGFTDDAFADLAAAIIRAERDFWNDHTDPWFLVTLMSNGAKASGGFSLGGTGLTDSFSLYCNTGISLDEGSPYATQIKILLGHEYFHTWNGGKIPSSDEEGAGYWFSEGFTDFYARRLLHRTGLITRDQFLGRLNEMLERAGANPERNAPASRINDLFWKNTDVQHLPYERGDQVAMAVDEKIRAHSDGKRNLDDLMKGLFARVRAGEKYSSELVLKMIEAETDALFAAAVRRTVIDGVDVALPESITEPRATRQKGQARSFDAGFDTSASGRNKIVAGVREGTAAHGAGLRDGQRIKRMSISSGGPGSPPSATVTIVENDQERVITYDPLTSPRDVTVYKAAN